MLNAKNQYDITTHETMYYPHLLLVSLLFSRFLLACQETSPSTVKVYCTNTTGDTWGYLRDIDQEIYTVRGLKGAVPILNGNFVEYLKISDSDYNRFSILCRDAAELGGIPDVNIPRPAWGLNNNWYLFAKEDGLVNDGSLYTQFGGDSYCD